MSHNPDPISSDHTILPLASPRFSLHFVAAFTISNYRMGKRVTKKSKREFMDALKVWRSANGLSQSQAAGRLGVPLKTLQNWEIARTKRQGFAETALLKIIAR